MVSLSRILVDIESAAPEHPALTQAVDLAARCGAHLTIVDVLPMVPAKARAHLPEGMEEELAAYRRSRLAEIAGRIDSVPVTATLLRGRPASEIIRAVLRGSHDLVVRAHGRDLRGPRPPFGPVDMELLRQCPCPVWLIGADARRPKRILAAVHTQTSDPGEQALNVSIVELALTLRDIEDGEITIFEAWSVFGENLLRSRMPAEQLSTISAGIRTAVEADLRTLLTGQRSHPGIARVELAMGSPGDVIPAYVEAQGMDLVVMGTVARTGVGGLVMGNTAERVLQRLKGDVLAVKPPGFVSPVELEG